MNYSYTVCHILNQQLYNLKIQFNLKVLILKWCICANDLLGGKILSSNPFAYELESWTP